MDRRKGPVSSEDRGQETTALPNLPSARKKKNSLRSATFLLVASRRVRRRFSSSVNSGA